MKLFLLFLLSDSGSLSAATCFAFSHPTPHPNLKSPSEAAAGVLLRDTSAAYWTQAEVQAKREREGEEGGSQEQRRWLFLEVLVKTYKIG